MKFIVLSAVTSKRLETQSHRDHREEQILCALCASVFQILGVTIARRLSEDVNLNLSGKCFVDCQPTLNPTKSWLSLAIRVDKAFNPYTVTESQAWGVLTKLGWLD